MAIAYAKFFPPTVLTTATATLYIVPAQPTTNLLRGGRVRLTNTSASVATATLYAVPLGGTAGAANMLLNATSIPVNGYVDVDIPILASGDFIQALSGTASAITAHALTGAVFS